jgi:hypothetical protein
MNRRGGLSERALGSTRPGDVRALAIGMALKLRACVADSQKKMLHYAAFSLSIIIVEGLTRNAPLNCQR